MDTQEYNDFCFWHTRPQLPSDVGLEENSGAQERPSSPGEQNGRPSSIGRDISRLHEEEDDEYEYIDQEDEAMEEEEAINDPMAMLSGGAGNAPPRPAWPALATSVPRRASLARRTSATDMLRQRERAQQLGRARRWSRKGTSSTSSTCGAAGFETSSRPESLSGHDGEMGLREEGRGGGRGDHRRAADVAPARRARLPERRSQAARRVALGRSGIGPADPRCVPPSALLSILQQNGWDVPGQPRQLRLSGEAADALPGVAPAPPRLFDVTGSSPPPRLPESVAHLSPCPASFRRRCWGAGGGPDELPHLPRGARRAVGGAADAVRPATHFPQVVPAQVA